MQEPSWEASGVRSGERKEETERWSWKLGRTVCLRAQEEKKIRSVSLQLFHFYFFFSFILL